MSWCWACREGIAWRHTDRLVVRGSGGSSHDSTSSVVAYRWMLLSHFFRMSAHQSIAFVYGK